MDDFFKELRIMETFLIFVGLAVTFSLMKSFMHISLGLEWAIAVAAIFFMSNFAKYAYEEFL